MVIDGAIAKYVLAIALGGSAGGIAFVSAQHPSDPPLIASPQSGETAALDEAAVVPPVALPTPTPTLANGPSKTQLAMRKSRHGLHCASYVDSADFGDRLILVRFSRESGPRTARMGAPTLDGDQILDGSGDAGFVAVSCRAVSGKARFTQAKAVVPYSAPVRAVYVAPAVVTHSIDQPNGAAPAALPLQGVFKPVTDVLP